jgi:nucleoside-diphosphate-sugar epimerase
MKVLVAGASGYIGARSVAAFRALPGTEVVGVSRRAGEGVTLDVAADRDALRALFERTRPDVVVNAAGTITPDLHRCLSAHVDVTANLICAAAEFAPGARFVQLGSAAEYGDAVREPDAMHEDTLPMPQGAYGVSKLAATLLAVREGAVRGLHPVSLRVFNLIGPDMTPGTIFPNVLRFLREPGRRPDDPLVVGALGIHRDFVHIDDVVAAIVAAATQPAARVAAGSIVNICSGRAVVVRDVVRELLDVAGHTGPIDERAGGSGRSGGVSWALGDNRRALERLDWRPRKDLSTGLRELVNRG